MDLDVESSLPHDLSGRYLWVGPAGRTSTAHTVALHGGGATSYGERRIEVHDTDESGAGLIEFAGRILSLADGSPAYELTTNLDTVGRVDLAGGGRGVGAHPKVDRATGELHLISSPGTATPLLHAISPGGMTRRTRTLEGAHAGVHDLALTGRRVVLVADDVISVTSHHEADAWSWHPVRPNAPIRVLAAHDDGDAVVLYVAGPALERWVIRRDDAAVNREVIDPAPQSSGCIDERRTGLAHRFLYSVGRHGGSIVKHDLVEGTRTHHDLGGGVCIGEFLFAADPRRSLLEDGGWLLGLVGDTDSDRTSLVVIDAADIAGRHVAAVRLPRRLPRGLHGLWCPSTPL